jgi:hypothetical protein
MSAHNGGVVQLQDQTDNGPHCAPFSCNSLVHLKASCHYVDLLRQMDRPIDVPADVGEHGGRAQIRLGTTLFRIDGLLQKEQEMETFFDQGDRIDHDNFQEWRRANPVGFFINCKTTTRWVLHTALCTHHGDAATPHSEFGSLTKQRKLCSPDVKELTRSAYEENKADLSVCSDCRPQIHAMTRRAGTACFQGASQKALTLADFWEWAMSDLLTNSTRGILAEYLVATALGVVTPDSLREPWGTVDIRWNRIKIEVKASAYVETWFQKTLTTPSFGIAPTREIGTTGKLSKVSKRQADLYVFCLLANKDPCAVDPMDLAQWNFYVVSSKTLNEKMGKQKRIGLEGLEKLEVKPVTYAGIMEAVTVTAKSIRF